MAEVRGAPKAAQESLLLSLRKRIIAAFGSISVPWNSWGHKMHIDRHKDRHKDRHIDRHRVGDEAQAVGKSRMDACKVMI